MTSSLRKDRDGDHRAGELYHYFQPDNPAMLPARQGASTFESTKSPSQAKASPNLVLTALAQLAATKLGVQRAIISLIDRDTLYVVAEASRSLNLGNNDLCDDNDDGLWMGCARGPVAGTLCEKTITLKPSPEQRYPFFIVQDLKQHPKYCNIPCVTGPPYFRYYAGTPLKTASGINLGSLYVIDPRPDLCLDDSGKEALGNIADAVMEYMETSRQSLEANRLARLLSGLNSFVQGEASSDIPVNLGPHSASSASSLQVPEQELEGIGSGPASHLPTLVEDADVPESPTTDAVPSVLLSDTNTSNRTRKELPSGYNSNRTRPTFQRAANIMRDSLDLGADGGVIIVDSSEDADQDPYDTSDEEKERKLAKVWGISDPKSPSDPGMFDAHPATQMDSHFVRRMIRRHPGGGLWYLHYDGTAFSSDDDGASSGSRADELPSEAPLPSVHPQSLRSLRQKDLQATKKYFPKATRIIFAPLWDSLNSRWFGGCFCWSCVETRVFSPHVELGGLFGFGSSLMVEHSRIQSQESANQKGDFISTISHELRSPLHGILAANEFLSDQVNSEFAKRLLDTIRACGQTLLDTFEQILDFTKINSFERIPKRSSSPHQGARKRLTGDYHRPQSLRIVKLVDVVALIEDAVESVYSGQALSNVTTGGSTVPAQWRLDPADDPHTEAESMNGSQVDVFIDAAPQNWLYVLEPGALRRIVMNVFGNALKYTERGSVSIHLEVQKSKKGNPVLFLKVSDTGRGISKEYLRSKVYSPFTQEDPLSPGSGLGLSLVRDILRSLNGSIAIRSQIGAGTVVKITFPLTFRQRHELPENLASESSPTVSGLIQSAKAEFEGRTALFIPAAYSSSSKPSSYLMIEKYLTEWFGMRLTSTSPADLVVVDEHDLDSLTNTESKFVLVLCRRRPGLSSAMTSANRHVPNTIWLTLPCGPHQLARTLLVSSKDMKSNEDPALEHKSSDSQTKALPLHQYGTLSGSTVGVPSAIPHGPGISEPVPPNALSATSGLPPASLGNGSQGAPTSSATGATDGARILLVEDNAINLALLKKFISRIQPQVLHTAVNGAKAVERVQEMPDGYQYIFMDLSMPVMDGFEATRKIRSIEKKRQTAVPAKIVALTGLGSDKHITKAYAAGVNVFLRKPFSSGDIMQLLDEPVNSGCQPGLQ